MIVLASQSPRRAELLRQVGIEFRCEPADVDERANTDEHASEFVSRLAFAKARAVHQSHPDATVLGADTAVIVDGCILGKPAGRDEAIAMLRGLAGRTHEVLTGVAVVGDGEFYALSTSRVRMRAIAAAEAAAYWDTGEPADKAGAYAIQGRAAALIEHIEGSYSGIMGLPLFETLGLLEKAGIWRRPRV